LGCRYGCADSDVDLQIDWVRPHILHSAPEFKRLFAGPIMESLSFDATEGTVLCRLLSIAKC
jgi:hypothetical protein